MKGLFASLTLITRIPLGFISGKHAGGPADGAAAHFPAAGYLAFLFWYAAYSLSFSLFSDSFVAACVALSTVYYFFNLFHFDGFMDSVDGMLSQKPREEALRIMKMGNIGPTALFFGVIYLALKLYLAAKLDVTALLPVFVTARWGMSFAAAVSQPAKEDGLGSMLTFGDKRGLALASVYLAALFLFQNAGSTAVMIGACALLTFILVKMAEKRLGGLTGDTFGLINELNEITLLLIALKIS